ncbi:hypothetical protein EV650_5121 [Kribbella kalugense]|uniref:Uncharacterized protein n=1 Tax=Kribbella kalugense TaxID=2512221 RepID=A0A4R7ZLX9_9ACTN|nr:hypothetical protein EV650_5121 [Kribbella kalugense]
MNITGIVRCSTQPFEAVGTSYRDGATRVVTIRVIAED